LTGLLLRRRGEEGGRKRKVRERGGIKRGRESRGREGKGRGQAPPKYFGLKPPLCATRFDKHVS